MTTPPRSPATTPPTSHGVRGQDHDQTTSSEAKTKTKAKAEKKSVTRQTTTSRSSGPSWKTTGVKPGKSTAKDRSGAKGRSGGRGRG